MYQTSGHVRLELVPFAGKSLMEMASNLLEAFSSRAIDHLKVQVKKVNWFSTYHVHHRVTDHFRKGRAFLLGDAAHAMTPDLGQGACQAIEDAVVLAAVVDGCASAAVTNALRLYTAYRLPRTAAIARRSRKAGALYQRPLVVRRAIGRLMSMLPADVIARGLTSTVDWQPPPVGVDRRAPAEG